MMIGPVSAWLVWGVFVLALAGVYTVWRVAAAGVLRAVYWWRDRREYASDEDDGGMPYCDQCDGWHRWSHDELDALMLELPPERSREELGFTGEQPAITPEARQALFIVGELGAHRERRAPWWEAEHRAAYESLGFDYPSGMIARVRDQNIRTTG